MVAIDVRSAAEIKKDSLQSSRVTKSILPEHRAFFGGEARLDFVDARQPYIPPIGGDITEPGLEARWKQFDEVYRAEDRITKFWIEEFEDAIVYPPHGLVRVGNTFIKDTIRESSMLQKIAPDVPEAEIERAFKTPGYTIEVDLPPVVKAIEAPVFVLGHGMFDNYFNWTLRYASRINIYQHLDIPFLVTPAHSKPYIGDTLDFFGIGKHSIIPLDCPIHASSIVVASPIALGRYTLSPQICLNLQEHPLVSKLDVEGLPTHLYIPRRDVKIRNIVNAEAVDAFFLARGFDVFDNAAYSIEAQVAAFKAAEVVVAPHGAGLANIVYCRPGTKVVEIVPEGYDAGVTSYRSLADIFHLEYIQVFAKEEKIDKKGNRCNSDISIDLQEIDKVLGAIGV